MIPLRVHEAPDEERVEEAFETLEKSGIRVKSTHDIVLQIIIRDNVIAQSGSIAPGNQIKSLDLAENTDDILTKGEYDGKFMVYYYDKQNGEKAVLNTEIPVNISVK